MRMNQPQRVAIVTGGGGGVGAATALMLAQRGYHVAITYNRNPAHADAVVQACQAHGVEALAMAVNVAQDADCEALAQAAAILAIVVLYWRTFWDVAKGLFKFEQGALFFVRNLLVAFFPAVLLGLAFGDVIQAMLGNAVLVCWSLIIGGFTILAIERWANPPAEGPGVAGVPLRTRNANHPVTSNPSTPDSAKVGIFGIEAGLLKCVRQSAAAIKLASVISGRLNWLTARPFRITITRSARLAISPGSLEVKIQ